MAEERVYTIPLRDAWNSAYHKRAKKAIRIIKEFAMKHMKVEKVKITTALNHKIWERGNAHPPRKIKVIIRKDGEKAVVDLFIEKDVKKEIEESQTLEEQQLKEDEVKQQESVVSDEKKEEKPKEEKKEENSEKQ